MQDEIEESWRKLSIPTVSTDDNDVELRANIIDGDIEAVQLLRSLRRRDADCVGVHIRRGDKVVVRRDCVSCVIDF